MTNLQLQYLKVFNAPAIPGLTFRHFRGAADFPAMTRVLAASEAADGNQRVVSIEEISNVYSHLTGSDAERDVLMCEVNGELIAYGRASTWKNSAGERLYGHFAFIDPAWRRRGVGRAMLGWMQERLRQIAATQPPDGRRCFQTWANDVAVGAESLLTGAGYQPVRHSFEMVRPDLENLPDFPLPDGLEVRPVLPEHYRQIWEADVEAFRDHWGYTEPSEEDYTAWLEDPTVFQPALWQIAWDKASNQVAGQVRGFINQLENEQYQRKRGWCEFISVRRPWRRRGLARALIVRTLRAFKEAGMLESALGVDTQNLTGALRVYEDCGFKPVKRSTTYQKPLD